MEGLKAKFSKKLNGESEVTTFSNPSYYKAVGSNDGYDSMPAENYKTRSYDIPMTMRKSVNDGDYTNFDNPVYELEENGQQSFDSQSLPSERGSTVGFVSKMDNKRKWLLIGVICIVIITIIIVAVAIGTTVAKNKEANTNTPRVAETTQSKKFNGDIRLTSVEYRKEYEDNSSEEFILLSEQFTTSMEKTMKDGNVDGFQSVEVIEMREGSVIVVYVIEVDASSSASPLSILDTIRSSIQKNNGQFGDYFADISSLSMYDGASPAPPPEVPETTTTTKVLSTTTIKTPTTTTATVGFYGQCGSPIIPECAHHLPYTSTNVSIELQNILKDEYLHMAERLSSCHNASTFYMCSFIAPGCTVDVTDEETLEPYFLVVEPCRQTCEDIRLSCKDAIAELGDDRGTFGDCSMRLPYTAADPHVCSYPGSVPPPLPPTTQPPTQVNGTIPGAGECFPIHHQFCSNISWSMAHIPGYYGHSSIQASYDFLSYLQGMREAGLRCHNDLHVLMCGIVLPKCDNGQRIPPCRSFCEEVLTDCDRYLSIMPYPIQLSCSIFPSDTNCTKNDDPLPSSTCDDSQYTCSDRAECIQLEKRCDGVVDCTDRSDEMGCTNSTQSCLSGKIRCPLTGACIPSTWRCDGYNDCGDGSDEKDCSCSPDEISCSTASGGTRCINGTYRCDGFENCYDGLDEQNCEEFKCRDDQFSCANGNCRPLRYKCDGDNDCGDGSDERNCLADEVCEDIEFKCTNGSSLWGSSLTSCVPSSWSCDRERDCSDGSDEKNCKSDCDPNPCKHGGTCTGDLRGYTCLCVDGTSGTHCEIVNEMPETTCNHRIEINKCKSRLAPYHNNTVATPFTQNQLSSYIEGSIDRLEQCYEHAGVFLCQFSVPDCGTTIGFPKFPCKSMCREFRKQCEHILNETLSIDRLVNCDMLPNDYQFPQAECFKLEHTAPTVAPPENVTAALGCQELKVPFCMDLGYNRTFMPNYFNMTHQDETVLYLDQVEFVHTNMPQCHQYFKKFSCSVFVPPCKTDGSGPLPPCRSLCQEVERDCGYWLDHVQWNYPFTCDVFPDSNDTSVCIPLPPKEKVEGCFGDQFACTSGECIHLAFRCDGVPDCNDVSDEETSMCGSAPCLPSQFSCGDGKCLEMAEVCDGILDCPYEGENLSVDEMNCQCNENEISCANGAGCIPLSYKCDTLIDCSDGSDEDDCTPPTVCSSEQFECVSSHHCIQASWRCDGMEDCIDGSDEKDCDSIECSSGYTRCAEGVDKYLESACIPDHWACDGEADCYDGSDEAGCFPCKSNPCFNGGECVESADNKNYTCSCGSSATGKHCEVVTAVLSGVHCDQEIIPECRSVLAPFYNRTREPITRQALLPQVLTDDILIRLETCAPKHGKIFMCGSTIPGCQSNGLPIMPCHHLCQAVTHNCSALLSDLGLELDCNLYPNKAIYPDTICIAEDGLTIPPSTSPPNSLTCEPSKSNFCKSFSNFTHIPNLIGQKSQSEAEVYLEIFETLNSSIPSCHEALQLYVCSILSPSCSISDSMVKYPCRELCTEVQERCFYHLSVLPEHLTLDCEMMDLYNPSEANCVIHDTQIKSCSEYCTGNNCNSLNFFQCTNGECVDFSRRCDDIPDCWDNTDELSCPTNVCDDNEYKCRSSGVCLPLSWKCDSYEDCLGGDDEVDCGRENICSKLNGESLCNDNVTCVPRLKRCDLNPDCPDGEDEECDDIVCAADEWKCQSGRCIARSYVCDNYADCPGNQPDDELNCHGSCPNGYFSCLDGYNIYSVNFLTSCINDEWICDDEPDCTDSSDEYNCPGSNKCETNPCENFGTCSVVDGSPVCDCAFGFSGRYCQIQELSPFSCSHPLLTTSSCRSYLPYNTTSSSSHIQNLLHESTEALLNRLSATSCYSLAELFVCSTRYPSCMSNGLPLLPCKHVCESFKSFCGHVITDEADLQNLDCTLFVDEPSSSLSCLSSNSMPEIKPTPNPSTVERTCTPLNNSFCGSLNYTSVSLPNYFGQTSHSEAEYMVHLISLLASDSPCKLVAHNVGCALALPKCMAENTPLPPCKSACLEFLNECDYFLDHYQIHLPVSCDSLPDSDDPDICMQAANIISVPPDCEHPLTRCHTSGECIHKEKWCNTAVDCLDASDEEYCETRTCSEGYVKCNMSYTHCIPNDWLCDGVADCDDGMDESTCTTECSENQFKCPAGDNVGERCIPKSWECDMMVDCPANTKADEASCTCENLGAYRCEDVIPTCLPFSNVCDGVKDCDSGSDEHGC